MKGKRNDSLRGISEVLVLAVILGLGYKVDWPVSIVLSAAALKIYADIFTSLIQIKLGSVTKTYGAC